MCFWHAPDRSEDASEARRLGGLRRRREKNVVGSYDLAGLSTVEGIRRLLEIAVVDALDLDNSVARARLLITAAMAATRLLETGDLEARLLILEAAGGWRRPVLAVSPERVDGGPRPVAEAGA